MSEENVVELARELFADWAKGNFGTTLDAMAPHAVLIVREGFIESGVHVGADQIGEYTRGFMGQYDSMVIEASDLQANGDTVFARVVQRGDGKASGIEMEMAYFMLISYRAGKIIRMESVIEEAEALEAAGLSE
ncbi:MAG: nuclear transport factor 2 family protein [Solirubrobacterales bacterium]